MVGDVTYDAHLLEAGHVPGVGSRRRLQEATAMINAMRQRYPGLVILPAHDPGAGRITRPGARRQCVLGVQRDRIIRVEHRRHAALGERGGPAAELVLGEKQHPPAARRCCRCSCNQRGGHPGGARPYHDYICVA